MNRSATSAFARIIECNLQEILEESLRLEDPFLRAYAQVLTYYLQSDVDALQTLCDEFDRGQAGPNGISTHQGDFLRLLSRLRLQIRRREVSEGLLARCLEFASSEEARDWSGEVHFVVAMGHEILRQELPCRELNRKAYRLLEKQGSHRKALKALHNHVAAEGRLHPERRLFAEFHLLYTKAKEIGDHVSAGTALNNIAQEYLELGAYLSALKYANRALSCLKRDRGTIHYFLALCNRCHILLQLGRTAEARIDLDEARISGFREIEATLQVLELLFAEKDEGQKKSQPFSEADLLPTWQTRYQDAARAGTDASRLPAPKLTPKEDQLLQLISQAPSTKFELMERLFGRAILAEAAENRFKNLVSRLKKKRPGLIILENDKYRISDEIYLPTG